MNKKRLCYMLRSCYPEALGIRKTMQRIKVQRLFRHMLPADVILECEKDSSKTEEAIQPFKKKWSRYLKADVDEMEDILKNAPSYKDRKDKDALRTDMFFCRLAYGFIPAEYVCFELEGKSPSERKKFVSDIDTNAFGYSVNNIRILQKILDKGDSAEHFRRYFKRDYVIVNSRKDFDAFQRFIKKYPVFVEKKVFSGMGKGTRLVDVAKMQISESEYFQKLLDGDKYLLEEVIVQKEEMAKYNDSSVNTVRCITFRTSNSVQVPYAFMRAGRKGAFVDNGGSGGLLIGINVENGKLCTDAYDEYNTKYENHPDSGVRFRGCQIPEWDALIKLCTEAAKMEKQVGYLSWDLAYTDLGWIVVEVNEVGQLIGPQTVFKKGIKTEIAVYLASMEKVF